jgi:hypothetical protein
LDNLKGAKGRDKASPRISTSELEIQEAKEMGGEAKVRDDEVGMGDEQFFDIYCRVLKSNWSRLFSRSSTTDSSE